MTVCVWGGTGAQMPHHTQWWPLALRLEGIMGKQARQCCWSITGRGAVMSGCQATRREKQECVQVGVVWDVHLHTPRSPVLCWFLTWSLASTWRFEFFCHWQQHRKSFHSFTFARLTVPQKTEPSNTGRWRSSRQKKHLVLLPGSGILEQRMSFQSKTVFCFFLYFPGFPTSQ